MIIENGTIQFKEKIAGTIDPDTGYPYKASSVRWSEPISCQIVPNTSTYLGKTNGERFSTAKYTLLMEEQPLPASEQLRIIDASGKSLGEFTMLSHPEHLEAVGEIKILV